MREKSLPIYDDIFVWKGWGEKMRLASGKCRLQIFDLNRPDIARSGKPIYIKNIVVITYDVAGSKMSVKGCAGHISTTVTEQFGIDPLRMLYTEYYPEVVYGSKVRRVIPERFELVEFQWQYQKALEPEWREID